MHFVESGHGEPVVMIHGNPTWSRLYAGLIERLAPNCHCVAPDHLGFGLSDKPPNADYSMRAHIRRLGLFMNQLALDGITLVVQDWGGLIGLGWASAHQQRIRRLVILNTAAFSVERRSDLWRIRPFPWALLALWPLKIPGLGELFVQGLNGFVRVFLPLAMKSRRLGAQEMTDFQRPYPDWDSRHAILASVRQIPLRWNHPTRTLAREVGERLDGWDVPTQIIWGMRDHVFVPWFMEEFERRLPNHQPTLRLERAGHFVPLEQPDIIAEQIWNFMQATPPADPVIANGYC